MRICLILWIVWYAYWIVSARHRVRATEESAVTREPWSGRLGYMGLLAVGFALLARNWPPPYFERQLWPSSGAWLASGLAVQALGLALAIWARRTLGKNWAGRITLAANQELVMRGPYRLVRHPIYSGVLFAILGTALVVGEVRAILGLLLMVTGVLIKLRREETALRQHFGGAYHEYALRVPALVPGIW
jgi:protein-S-isoprenylcysteine O-methyltransferase Ste14